MPLFAEGRAVCTSTRSRCKGAPGEHLENEELLMQLTCKDEGPLAHLGYKQSSLSLLSENVLHQLNRILELNRGLGLFENWAATFSVLKHDTNPVAATDQMQCMSFLPICQSCLAGS